MLWDKPTFISPPSTLRWKHINIKSHLFSWCLKNLHQRPWSPICSENINLKSEKRKRLTNSNYEAHKGTALVLSPCICIMIVAMAIAKIQLQDSLLLSLLLKDKACTSPLSWWIADLLSQEMLEQYFVTYFFVCEHVLSTYKQPIKELSSSQTTGIWRMPGNEQGKGLRRHNAASLPLPSLPFSGTHACMYSTANFIMV